MFAIKRHVRGSTSVARPCRRRHQRAIPVVVSEGPTAAGGVSSRTVDPSVPLGAGLGPTWAAFHGPHVRIATAKMNAAVIAANLRKLPPNPDYPACGSPR